MTPVSNPSAFCAALGLYFGDSASEGYRPGETFEGPQRIREAFPANADLLIAEIDALFRAARGLPGLWGDGALPLEEACLRVRSFLETEYAFVPATLRKKIENALSYELWK